MVQSTGVNQMKVMVQKKDAQRPAFEMQVSDLCTPSDNVTGMPSERANAVAIGALSELLVRKGVCTVAEVQKATGTDDYEVVGAPTRG
jgi:hypothetical protein